MSILEISIYFCSKKKYINSSTLRDVNIVFSTRKKMISRLNTSYNNYFLILFFIFQLQSVYTQNKIKFEHFSTEAGISNDLIYQIIQDKYGFLWFATQAGLNKYDGYNFTVYKNDPQNKNSLANDNLQTVCEFNEFIWVGTWGGGLNKFDRINNSIYFQNNASDSTSLISNKIHKILFDHKNILWIATLKGLDEYNPTTNSFKHYLKGENILKIAEDKDGTLYLTSDTHLFILDKNRSKIKKIDLHDKLSLAEGHPILIDHIGIIWIGTEKGLVHYNPSSEKLVLLDKGTYKFNNIDKAKVNCIYEDRDFNIWAGTYRKGLYKFNRKEKTFYNYINNINDPNSITYNSIREIYGDKSGMLWISTVKGLEKIDLKPIKFNNYYYIPNNPKGLSENVILDFFEEDENTIWIGTDHTLNRFNRKKNEFEHINLPATQIFGNLVSAIAICKGPDQNLWIGTRMLGLLIYNPRSKKFIDIKNDSHFPKSLSEEWTRIILKDRDANYWLGTNKGLYYYNTLNKEFSIYQKKADKNSLSDNSIICLYEDTDGILWIGTQDGGLNRFDKRTKKFTHFRFDITVPNSISSDYITSIYGDENNIWLGTISGLNKLEKNTNKIIKYNTKEGFTNSSVTGILSDSDGNLWIISNSGLSKFNPKENTVKYFDRGDGLPGNKFNGLSCYKTKVGEMFFGGDHGFISFFPKQVIDNSYIPPIVITKLNVLYKQKNLEKDISQVDEIVLDYTENNIQFGFAALDYTYPQKNKYKYMLEGFDKDWISAKNERFANYTNLEGGTYTFRVIGSNNDGYWNNKGVTITLIIIPPIWKTWWFRILFLIAISFLVYFIYKRRIKYVEERQKELEILNEQLNSEIKERKLTEIELIKTKEEAEKSNKLKSEFLNQISHEIRTPIHAILNLSAIVKDEASKKNADDKKFAELLKGINVSGNRIVRTIDLVLNMSELQTGTYKYHAERLNLITDIIDKVYTDLSNSAEKAGLKFILDFKTDQTQIIIDRYSTFQIIHNIVENAIKFTKQGTVTISVYKNEKLQLVVEVKDTGIGISHEYLPNLFTFFTQEEHGYSRSYDGNGLGLALAKKYCDLNNIQISVKSIKGAGSTFTLIFTEPKI
jgi:signal transduction histidine kinase/ligand-binding sensor domain-containing protein